MPDHTPRRRPRTPWHAAQDMRPVSEIELTQPLRIATASAELVSAPPNSANQWRLDFGDPAFGAALARVAAPPPESPTYSIPLTVPLRPRNFSNREVLRQPDLKARLSTKVHSGDHSQSFQSLPPKRPRSRNLSRSHVIVPDSCALMTPSSGSDSESSRAHSPIPLAHRHRKSRQVMVPDSCPLASLSTQDASTFPPSPGKQAAVTEFYPVRTATPVISGSRKQSTGPVGKIVESESCELSIPESKGLESPSPRSHGKRFVVIPETCPLSTPESNRYGSQSEYLSASRDQNLFPDSASNDEVITPMPSRLAAFARMAEWKPSPDSRVIVPDTPDQSDQEPLREPLTLPASRQSFDEAPTSQLGAHSESTLYNKSFSSGTKSVATHTPTSRGTSAHTESRFSGGDSDCIGLRGRCLVDGEEVNRIRRDLGMSPASSFGPNQSLALDPQVASYALQVLRQSAGLDRPTPSVDEGKASSLSVGTRGSSHTEARKEDSVSLGEVCPVTPHKAGAVSRIRRNGSSLSSMDGSESSSVLRDREQPCRSGQTGDSNDFNIGTFARKSTCREESHVTPKNNTMKGPTGTESDIDTGRSSIHKRLTSRGIKRARQQLRFDVTPMPLRLADDNSDEDPARSRGTDWENEENLKLDPKKPESENLRSSDMEKRLRSPTKQSMLPSKRKIFHEIDKDPNTTLGFQRNLRTATTVKSMFSTAAGTWLSVSKNKLAEVFGHNSNEIPNPKRVALMRHTEKRNLPFKQGLRKIQKDDLQSLMFAKASSILDPELADKVSLPLDKLLGGHTAIISSDRTDDICSKVKAGKSSSVSVPVKTFATDNQNINATSRIGEPDQAHDIPKFDDKDYDPFCLARKSSKKPRESIESLVVKRLPELQPQLRDPFGVQRLSVGELVTPVRAYLLPVANEESTGIPGSSRVEAVPLGTVSTRKKHDDGSILFDKVHEGHLNRQLISHDEEQQSKGRKNQLHFDHAAEQRQSGVALTLTNGRGRPARPTENEVPKSARLDMARERFANQVFSNEKGVVTPAQIPMFTTAKGESISFSNANKGKPGSHFRQPLFSTGSGRPVAVSKLNKVGTNTPAQPFQFATASGRTLHLPKTPLDGQPLFATASGRTLPLPKTPLYGQSLFATASGRTLPLMKTPLDKQSFFATAGGQRAPLPANQPLARVLPFNTNSSPRAKTHLSKSLSAVSRKNVSFRALPQSSSKKMGPILAELPSRRQLFQTPPAKLDGTPYGTKPRHRGGGIKNTPFKRPRRVPPVKPTKEMNAEGKVIQVTNSLELFFPKGPVPRLTRSGRLVSEPNVSKSDIIPTSNSENHAFVANPADGALFCFSLDRFGDWSLLPEDLKRFCKLDSISLFSVDDCMSLLCHVFPSAEKRAATRIGSRAWTKMSYGLSTWKLSKLESDAVGNDHPEAKFLTVANLLRDIWRRVDREWHQNQAPHLTQMLRRDTSPRSHVVLMLSNIVIEESKVLLEVSDGWYICRMKLCELLSSRVKAGLLSIGDKIHVYDSELVSSPNTPFFFGDGDEMGSSILAPSANCVKKVSTKSRKCRLGIRRTPLFIRTLTGLSPKGGKCPGAQIVILRSYPVFFIESVTDHESERHSIFRRREAEETEQAKLYGQRESLWVEGVGNSNGENAEPKIREVRNAIDFSVCGIGDDPTDPRCEKIVRVYKPDDDLVRLLSKEGNVVHLPVLKPAGKNWVVMSASCVRPLTISPTTCIPCKPRSAKSCEELNESTVVDGMDFDGVFVALHTTAMVNKTRHVYMVDNTEDSNVLVLELRGVDAECVPRAFGRTNRKHEFPIVALRDATKEGVDAQLGLVHSFATLRAEILSAAALERRRDRSWKYLQERLISLAMLVKENEFQLQLLREAVISFASGDRSSISAYFNCTQE